MTSRLNRNCDSADARSLPLSSRLYEVEAKEDRQRPSPGSSASFALFARCLTIGQVGKTSSEVFSQYTLVTFSSSMSSSLTTLSTSFLLSASSKRTFH